MQVNLKAIETLRGGATGRALAEHLLRSIRTSLAQADIPHPDDRKSREIGMLTYELRKVCDLLALAVEEPDTAQSREAEVAVDERSPLSQQLLASIAYFRAREDAQRNLTARAHGKSLGRRFSDHEPSAFQQIGSESC